MKNLLFENFIYSYTEEAENEIEFSASEIQNLIEIVTSIDFKTILTENDLSILSEANKYNFKNVGLDSNKVNGQIQKTGTEIANTLKKEGLTKTSKSKILKLYKDMFTNIESANEDILDSIDDVFGIDSKKKETLSKYDPTKIKKALLVLLEVVIVNSICATIFTILFGPAVGQIILAIFVAPTVEETAKQLAIRGDYHKEFTIVFNIFEFSSYIYRGSVKGIAVGVDMFGNIITQKIPLANNLRARSLAVGMHITTTVIQWLSRNEKIQKMLHINMEDEDAKEKCSLFGHIIGWIIHAMWNSAASFSPKFVSALSGLK